MYEEVMFKEMRSFTKEESKLYEESLNKIFKPTGNNMFDHNTNNDNID